MSRDPPQFQPQHQRVDSEIECCCCDRGRIRGHAYLDKSLYSIGDTVLIHIKLETLERSVESVRIVLRKKCHMVAPEKSRDFYADIQTYKLPGISKVDALREIEHKVVLNNIRDGEISPTYIGHIIILTYELCVELVMEGICGGSA
jgi:hypothetical protein